MILTRSATLVLLMLACVPMAAADVQTQAANLQATLQGMAESPPDPTEAPASGFPVCPAPGRPLGVHGNDPVHVGLAVAGLYIWVGPGGNCLLWIGPDDGAEAKVRIDV